MVQEWERSVSGLLEEELNVGKFKTTKWFVKKFMTFYIQSRRNQKKKRKNNQHNYGWYPSSFSKCRNR